METKYCPSCKIDKPIGEFGKNKSRRDGLQSVCRECSKTYHANHYRHNRDAQLARNRAFRHNNVELLRAYKASKGCQVCSEKEPCCLDFHHPNDDKEFGIARKAGDMGVIKLFEEVVKCVVVCANCHRKIHAGLIPRYANW